MKQLLTMLKNAVGDVVDDLADGVSDAADGVSDVTNDVVGSNNTL